MWIPVRQEVNVIFEDLCKEYNIPFTSEKSVSPYDNTTLFCPSGMQQYKKVFQDKTITGKTVCNIQSCIRLKDLDEIGDGIHFLYFNMLGMFSFRELSLQEGIDFWMEFMNRLDIKVDTVTIHPDKQDWKKYYKKYDVIIKDDIDCTWTDGESEDSYCTEFYVNNVEIGNIVRNGGDSLDVGFGYERIDELVNGSKKKTNIDILIETIEKIIESGYKPGNKEQGYILRKLLRELVNKNGYIDNEHFKKEKERQERMKSRYEKMIMNDKNKNKSSHWWFDTHGIDINLM